MENWIEKNKGYHPFTAGALAYMLGKTDYYGCHYGMRSTRQWAIEQFKQGWLVAQRDYKASNATD
jgi:hypothetical protein